MVKETSWNYLYNFLRGGQWISSTNLVWTHCWDIVFSISWMVSVLTCDFFMYTRFWLLSLTVCRKLGGPPHLFMYFRMTPLGVSWIDRAPSLILTSLPPSIKLIVTGPLNVLGPNYVKRRGTGKLSVVKAKIIGSQLLIICISDLLPPFNRSEDRISSTNHKERKLVKWTFWGKIHQRILFTLHAVCRITLLSRAFSFPIVRHFEKKNALYSPVRRCSRFLG